VVALAAAGLLLSSVFALSFYLYAGSYGFNVILRRGGSVWVSIAPDDPRISDSMRLALRSSPPKAEAGTLAWNGVAEGFEAGELRVVAEGAEVDRILLARGSTLPIFGFRSEILRAEIKNCLTG
jgi:hypothetical protein